MDEGLAFALLRWNSLNPMSKTGARIWLAFLVVVCVWVFGPVVAQWWRGRK
jgi:hypothetical protein